MYLLWIYMVFIMDKEDIYDYINTHSVTLQMFQPLCNWMYMCITVCTQLFFFPGTLYTCISIVMT